MIGTRSKGIKMAVVMRAGPLPRRFQHTFISAAHHREMLDHALGAFDLKPCIDLQPMQPNQRVPHSALRALSKPVQNTGRDSDFAQPSELAVLCEQPGVNVWSVLISYTRRVASVTTKAAYEI